MKLKLKSLFLNLTLLFLFVSCNQNILLAQIPYSKIIGDWKDMWLDDVVPYGDTSFFWGGKSDIGIPGDSDFSYCMLTDDEGDLQWIKEFNYGSGETVNAVGTDGEYLYVVSRANNTYYTHLSKLDASGNTIWSKRYLADIPEFSKASLYKMIVTEDGLVCAGIVVHTTEDFSRVEGIIVKLDFDGNIVWSNRYTPDLLPEWETPQDFIQLENGDFLFVGYTESYGIPGPWYHYGFLMRVSSTGEFIWAKGFNNREADCAVELSTNDLLVEFQSFDGDFLLAQFAGEGDLIQAVTIEQESGIVGVSDMYAYEDGSAVLATFSEEQAGLVKIDASLDIVWEKEQLLNDQAHRVSQLEKSPDGGFIRTGRIYADDLRQILLLKYDSLGNGTCPSDLYTPYTDERDDVIIYDMSFTSYALELTNSVSDIGELIEIERDEYYCCDSVIADFNSSNEGLVYDFTADPLSFADYEWIILDDTLEGKSVSYTFPGPGSYDVCMYVDNICSSDWVCKTIDVIDDAGIQANYFNSSVQVYPIPFTNHLTVESTTSIANGAIKIFDLNGRIVNQTADYTGEVVLDLSELSRGLYYLHVYEQSQLITYVKIMKF